MASTETLISPSLDAAVSPGELATQAEVSLSKWFALVVAARHEKTVSRILINKGNETFLPVYKRRHLYGARRREFELPLFPGYVFCRFDLSHRLPILTTPGVIQIVGAGRIPTPVDEREIAFLQTAATAKVPMEPVAFWKSGQRVRVVDGPLAGIEGIVLDVKSTLRLVVSVTLLRRSVQLEIDADRVNLVSLE